MSGHQDQGCRDGDVPTGVPIASRRSRQSPAGREAQSGLARTTNSHPSSSVTQRQKRVSKSQLLQLHESLSDRDLAILHSLRSWRLMRIAQLVRLHFHDHSSTDTAGRVARRVLNRLAGHRLIGKLDRRIGGVRAGSAGTVYRLAPLGHRLIDGSTRYWHEPSQLFTNHTLAIAELGSLAVESARMSDQIIEITDLVTEPQCWRTFSSGLTHGQLRPDLLIRLAGADYEASWFIEIDLGTESKTRLSTKCQTYLDYLDSGEEQAEHGYFPSVMWVAETQRRRRTIEDVIHALDHPASSGDDLFHVATIDRAIDRIMSSVG